MGKRASKESELHERWRDWTEDSQHVGWQLWSADFSRVLAEIRFDRKTSRLQLFSPPGTSIDHMFIELDLYQGGGMARRYVEAHVITRQTPATPLAS